MVMVIRFPGRRFCVIVVISRVNRIRMRRVAGQQMKLHIGGMQEGQQREQVRGNREPREQAVE